MNYRRVARVCIGFIVLLFGFVAFMQDVNAVGLVCLGASIMITILLFRKTSKDEEYMRRHRNGELLGQRAELDGSRDYSEKTPEERLKCGFRAVTM